MQWPAGGVPRWSRDAADGVQLAPCAALPSLELSLKCQRCPPSPPRHYHNSPEVFAIAFQSAVPRRRVGWVPPVLLPGLPTLHLLGCEGLPGILGVLKPPCWMSAGSRPPLQLLGCWSMLVPILLPRIFPWHGLGREWQRGGGTGTVWGQQQGEGMQAVNPGQRQSSSPRGCLPRRDTPSRAAPVGGVGGPAPPSFPSHPSPPPAAPRLRTWAGGGGVCRAALRLSSARGRQREPFVPVTCRLAAAHRDSPTPGCTGAHRSSATAATGSANVTGTGLGEPGYLGEDSETLRPPPASPCPHGAAVPMARAITS